MTITDDLFSKYVSTVEENCSDGEILEMYYRRKEAGGEFFAAYPGYKPQAGEVFIEERNDATRYWEGDELRGILAEALAGED